MAAVQAQITTLLRDPPRPRRHRRRRLLDLRPVAAARDGQRDQRHADPAARRHRLDLADRRRHRDHEHHAGVGPRADPRDRHPQGRRRAAPRHPRPVPDRGADAVRARRPDRHRAGPQHLRPDLAASAGSPSPSAPRPSPSPSCSASASASCSACGPPARRRASTPSARCATSRRTLSMTTPFDPSEALRGRIADRADPAAPVRAVAARVRAARDVRARAVGAGARRRGRRRRARRSSPRRSSRLAKSGGVSHPQRRARRGGAGRDGRRGVRGRADDGPDDRRSPGHGQRRQRRAVLHQRQRAQRQLRARAPAGSATATGNGGRGFGFAGAGGLSITGTVDSITGDSGDDQDLDRQHHHHRPQFLDHVPSAGRCERVGRDRRQDGDPAGRGGRASGPARTATETATGTGTATGTRAATGPATGTRSISLGTASDVTVVP